MKLLVFCLLTALSSAQSSTMAMSMSTMSSMTTTALMTSSTSLFASSLPTTGNVSAAEYTITALPAVMSQPSCIYNCLIPIGLADPSGCDDVTNECACLNAPSDVLTVLQDCIQTVCKSSTSTYAAVATSLYESYCQSAFGTAAFAMAFTVEASEAAASSTADMSSTATGTASMSGMSGTMTMTTASASATAKNVGEGRRTNLLLASVVAAVGLVLLTKL